MGFRGPIPKGHRSRERDQRRLDAQTIVLRPDGRQRGPELPDSHDWPEQTRHWWNTWRMSAQAQLFEATDWDFLLCAALLHADFMRGNTRLAGELRLWESKLGATPADLTRLRITIIDER
jgi:hypothetical protein